MHMNKSDIEYFLDAVQLDLLEILTYEKDTKMQKLIPSSLDGRFFIALFLSSTSKSSDMSE